MSAIIKTCIVCPKGCQLTIEEINKDERIINVSGNQCKRGEAFAKEEMYSPKRTLQTTVKTAFPDFERLPVKTSDSIPKDMMFDVMKIAKKVIIKKPIKIGDIVAENVLGTGVDLIATASININMHKSTRR